MDREKVIKGLECCARTLCEDCPYCQSGCCFINEMLTDALNLLKAQSKRYFFAKSNGEIIPLVNTAILVPNGYLENENGYVEVVRCKDCVKKGNSYLCRFDRDLEEYGGHRTEAYDDWFCADGERAVK